MDAISAAASSAGTDLVQILMLRKQMEAMKTQANAVIESMPPPAPTPREGGVDSYA